MRRRRPSLKNQSRELEGVEGGICGTTGRPEVKEAREGIAPGAAATASPASDRADMAGICKVASRSPLVITIDRGDTDLTVQPLSTSAPTRNGFAGLSLTAISAAPRPSCVTTPRKDNRLTTSGAADAPMVEPFAPSARATAAVSTAMACPAPATGGTACPWALLARKPQYRALPAASAHTSSVTVPTASRGEAK